MSMSAKQPREHQIHVLERSKHRNRLGLFHEMRLGKTLTTIWWLKPRKEVKKVLVAAPLSVLASWEEELSAECQSSVVLSGSKDQRVETAMSSPARWHLINHEGLTEKGHRRSNGKAKPVPAPICFLPWDAVIVDESTCLKNPRSLISQVVCSVFEKVKYKAVLSGLPNPESILDFFQQMKFLRGGLLGCSNYFEFKEKHFASDDTGWDWWPRLGTTAAMRSEMLQCCEFLTRKEAGLGNERVREVRTVNVPSKVLSAIYKAEKELAVGTKETNWPMVARGWSLQLLGGRPQGEQFKCFRHNAKIKELFDLLDGELREEQVVVWFRFTEELMAVVAELLKRRITYGIIDGSVSREDRATYCRQFRAGKRRVMCCQYKAAKFGIDLSSSSTNVFYSLVESQKEYFQANERIESLSKCEPLLSIHLLVPNSLDTDIYLSLKQKNMQSRFFLRDVHRRLLARVKKGEVRESTGKGQ